MGVFDALDIRSAPDVLLATLERPQGPLESGFESDGAWVSEPGPQRIRAGGFGVDPDGNPYFDLSGADAGDEADLWLDPETGDVWLEKGIE